MKWASIAGLGLFALWVVLALLQLWFATFDSETFFKITVTCAIVLALVVVGALVHREYIREADLKDKGYLD